LLSKNFSLATNKPTVTTAANNAVTTTSFVNIFLSFKLNNNSFIEIKVMLCVLNVQKFILTGFYIFVNVTIFGKGFDVDDKF